MATDGTLTMLHAFASSDPAHNPHGAFVEGTDGNLYAVSGLRVLQMTRSGAATAFGPAIAASEVSDLIAGNDGRLYAGLARVSPGPTYEAALLSMSPAGDFVFGRWQSVSLLWRPSFQSPDGSVLGFRDHDFNQPPWRDVVHVSSGGEILHPNTFADTPEPPPIFYRFFKITSMIDGGDGYAYATTANDGANRSGSILRFSFGNRAPLDFTGDGKSNRVFFRPSLGQWININSGFSPKFGGPGDLPVPADYDGDGESDLAIYRPGDGSWYISPTTTAVVYRTRWGGALDRPVPGDYDGDRKADIAVFRPASGTWYVLPSTSAPF